MPHNNHQYQLTPSRMGRADGSYGACRRRRRRIRVRPRRRWLLAVILCVSVLMSLVRPAARSFRPPTWSDRPGRPTAGRRRSITTCPRRGGRAGPGPALSPAVRIPTDDRPPGGHRRLSPSGRAESATSGLHSLGRSLIQSRLDFSPASFGASGGGRPAGIVVHAIRASCQQQQQQQQLVVWVYQSPTVQRPA